MLEKTLHTFDSSFPRKRESRKSRPQHFQQANQYEKDTMKDAPQIQRDYF